MRKAFKNSYRSLLRELIHKISAVFLKQLGSRMHTDTTFGQNGDVSYTNDREDGSGPLFQFASF
jgi:hypothetical protein